MKEELSRCCYRCDLCAARSPDADVRQKLVDGWRKIFGHQMYTADNVRCDGCLHDGRLADKSCRVRPCVLEKQLENCAHCDEFPCDRLDPILCSGEKVRARLPDMTDEEYNLCVRMFDNRPRLAAIRKSLGKE